ncbi:HNH endonuclease [Streptomyces uncialis]|uniref:HNH endonuclease n=1 Tax=Streptomyces uncialis TaxID=1048205 RepID=UPI00364F7FD4
MASGETSVKGRLLVGDVLRSGRNRNPETAIIDGYPNIHHVTASRDLAQIQLAKGINPIAGIPGADRSRRPAILIRSSPWKAGTEETPWHDRFDLETGHVRYFGDHRVDHTVPVGNTQGNKALLRAFQEHQASTPAQRALAVPLLVFKAVSRNRTHKGYVEFCGVAVIERIEQIEQEAEGRSYPNYCYDLAVLDLSAEGDRVDWAWIEARGDQRLSAGQALERAPRSWRQWVEHGHALLPEVRRQTASTGSGTATPQHSSGADERSPGLFPAPRRPHDASSSGSVPSSEDLTANLLMQRLRSLRVHQRNGLRSRHKPLALLWGISRVATGKPRRAPWHMFQDEVGGLLAEFGRPEFSVTPEYPFWHLRTSNLWDIHGLPPEQTTRPHAATFDRFAPEAGMTEQAARLLEDPFVRSQAVAVLRETYLDDIDHHALMNRVGLAGHANASGVQEDGAEGTDRDEESRPAPRRPGAGSQIVRDPRLIAAVKRLHANRCQVCGMQLPTRFSTYSEAAHIRGLGRPHDGPDILSNLLVLCPNHHVQFDTLAIYIAADDSVRRTADDGLVDQLRRHPAHPMDDAHLRYHRALCGRDLDQT